MFKLDQIELTGYTKALIFKNQNFNLFQNKNFAYRTSIRLEMLDKDKFIVTYPDNTQENFSDFSQAAYAAVHYDDKLEKTEYTDKSVKHYQLKREDVDAVRVENTEKGFQFLQALLGPDNVRKVEGFEKVDNTYEPVFLVSKDEKSDWFQVFLKSYVMKYADGRIGIEYSKQFESDYEEVK